jgi:hypothetical protein
VKDNFGNLLEEASTVINVVKKNPETMFANVLCVGDSLTSNGQWVKGFKERLHNDGFDHVNLVGSCIVDDARFEGYGGWTYNSYNTENKSNDFAWVNCTHSKTSADQHSLYSINSTLWKIETIETNRLKMIRVSGSENMPTSGTLEWVSGGNDTGNITFTSSEIAAGNPFWNPSTNSVDFANYMTSIGMGGQIIDYCIILLGWNQSTDTEEQLLDYVRQEAAKLRYTPNPGDLIGGPYIYKRFGNWDRVVALCGLPKPTKMPPMKSRTIYKEEYKRQVPHT